MNKYVFNTQLGELVSEGQHLTQHLLHSKDRQRTLIWFARAKDMLALFLPLESELRKAFSALADTQTAGTSASVPEEAVALIRVAADINRIQRDESMDLRHDIESVINDTFAKSWWFRIPVAILVAATVVALGGVVQIGYMNIDIRQRAAAAVAKADEDIKAQKLQAQSAITKIGDDATKAVQEQLKTELRSHVETMKHDISAAAQIHVEDLKRQKTPELEAAFATAKFKVESLQHNVAGEEKRLTELESRAAELSRAIAKMTATEGREGPIDRLGGYLNRSRGYVLTEAVVVFASLLLSGWSLYRTKGA